MDVVLDLMDDLTRDHLAPLGKSDTLNPLRRQLIARLGRTFEAVHNLSQIANAHIALGESHHAIEALNQAQDIASNLDMQDDVIDLGIQLGDAHIGIGDITTAAQAYTHAFDLAETLGDLLIQAQAHAGLMRCTFETANFAAALDHNDTALAILSRAEGDARTDPVASHALARCRSLLGLQVCLVQATLGRFSPALQAVTHGRRLAIKLGETLLEAAFETAEATIRIDLGELDQARTLANQATTVAMRLHNPQLAQQAGSALALTHLCGGQLDEAEHAARQASRTFHDARSMRPLTLHGIALIRRGDLEAAHRAFSRAEAHARSMTSRDARCYDAQDILGLATAGLVLCGDTFRQDAAIQAFRAGRATTIEERVVRRTLRLVTQLCKNADPTQREEFLSEAAGPLRHAI